MWRRAVCGLGVLALGALAHAAPTANPWPAFEEPAPGPSRAIGGYSAGCLQGGVALPLDGDGYQVMRPSRRRYFGHPALVSYVQALGARVASAGAGVLLVGDLSQPRGGRAKSGHASHQTGLDVDLWYTHPPRARNSPLPRALRETLPAPSVLEPRSQALRPKHRAHVERVLRLAVMDPRVERVFVNPNIKRALCEAAPGDRGYLRKIRPWYGHDDHFHVRLSCQPDDVDCRAQAPLPEGDGCDTLAWWFDEEAQAARREARRTYQKTVSDGRGWPAQCDALLGEHATHAAR